MSLATEAALSAFAAAATVHGESVLYQRGEDLVALTVNPGHSDAEVINAQTGLVTTIELQDFLLRSQDLEIAHARFLPERGDRIILTHAGIERTYVVTHPDANQAPYRRSDPHGVILRVHTLLQAQEAAA